ncbi:unnamed protein product [Moneuplotes crassus]|uniref:Uncharacterized protein n=1 Tax=Euplotes crassus TaxID=5936 RepID=A0AAD1UMT4_EUPCR|nr:unnamed protein product [Moneuplotes crassus]
MMKSSTPHQDLKLIRRYQQKARRIHTSMSERGMRISDPRIKKKRNISQESIPKQKSLVEEKIEPQEVILQQKTFQETFETSKPIAKQILKRNLHTSSSPRINVATMDPNKVDTRQLLMDKNMNFMVTNTQDFLEEEEIDIHGLSNLSEHKLVRFKYPRCMGSNYLKDFKPLATQKLIPRTRFGDHGDCFNLNNEKRRHINVNKMVCNTTNKDTFTDFQVQPGKGLAQRSQSCTQIPEKPIVVVEKHRRDPNNSNEYKGTLSFSSPFFNKSSYQKNFQNFGEGIMYQAKHPKYPVYMLPFKGDSIYRESFRRKLTQRLKEDKSPDGGTKLPSSLDPVQIKLKVCKDHIKQNFSMLKMNGKPKEFYPSKTTQREVYMAKLMKPKDDPVHNSQLLSNFKTIYSNEFVEKPIIRKKKIKTKPMVW